METEISVKFYYQKSILLDKIYQNNETLHLKICI